MQVPDNELFDIDRLNPYAREVADLLFAEYPDWIQFAGVHPDGNELEINVPVPDKDAAGDLTIYTRWGFGWGCISLWFDLDANDFGCGYPVDDAFKIANEVISDIINERIVAGAKRQESGYYLSVGYFPVDEIDSIPAGKVSQLRSFLGTYNRDFE